MGQFGNQPDFATNDIQVVTPNNTISTATNLNASVIYIGDNTTAGDDMVIIPAGTVGPSIISGFSSPGYAGSNGTGYGDEPGGTNSGVLGGSGTGLDIIYPSANGEVTGVVEVEDQGTGYLNGDLVTIDDGDGNAVFRIEAAPGLPTEAQSITFYGLQAGGFLPVTVDYVLASSATNASTTTVRQLIAAR